MSMPNTMTMPRYRVENIFRVASDAAFRFVNLEKRHKRQSERHAGYLEEVGGKISPTWVVMSIVGLCAAIGFGIYGAYNAQGAIAGLVDPMGEGMMAPTVLMLIGASISIVGMLFGHLMYEGVSDGIKTDPHTGAYSITGKLWLGVVGLLGAIVYVCYQFYLVKSATDSSGIDASSNLNYMPYVVAGIAILELMIGAFILHRAFDYGALIITALILTLTVRQLNKSARVTNDSFRQYLRFIDGYNSENPSLPMEREGNPNIRRAIAHYSGLSENLDQQTTNKNQEEPESSSPSGQSSGVPDGGGNSKDPGRGNTTRNNAQSHEGAEQTAKDFIYDTAEEDLTV